MILSNDTRHKMLCFLADWFLLNLPPGCSDHVKLEVWDREYDYMKRHHNDLGLWEAAREAGFDTTPDEN